MTPDEMLDKIDCTVVYINGLRVLFMSIDEHTMGIDICNCPEESDNHTTCDYAMYKLVPQDSTQ